MMNPSQIEFFGTIVFFMAVLHTFCIKLFQHWARQFNEGSIGENLFHLLGEVEVVFGLWAGILAVIVILTQGSQEAIRLIEGSNFTEPLFVFAMMTLAATRPIIYFAGILIQTFSHIVPLKKEASFYFSALFVGPLLGSLITEPAAMTVTALILRQRFYDRKPPEKLMYLTLGTLFVNVSIGGVLTHFAAPPVLMVAKTWNWDLFSVFKLFGWKALFATFLNSLFAVTIGYRYLNSLQPIKLKRDPRPIPHWLVAIHLITMALVVLTSHYPSVFIGIFLFFLGFAAITQEYQEELQLKQSLLVAFFLGGLVVLGGQQSWWLTPLVARLDALSLFVGTTGLTAFTDNAAITYLGSQIPGTSESFKYALVAGAVAGGGLTVIANAPNPAGFAILRESFGTEGISPARLFLGALFPTFIVMASFWWLPS
jgi:hypothetical protein